MICNLIQNFHKLRCITNCFEWLRCRRSRSSSRHRHERSEDRIDKKRLLEIARKNAITMLKNGTLPGTLNMDPEAKERALTKMRYGGM